MAYTEDECLNLGRSRRRRLLSTDASSEGICHPEKQMIETTAAPFFPTRTDQLGNSWEFREVKECTLSDGSKVQGFLWFLNYEYVLEIHVDENTTPIIFLDYVGAFALTCVQNRISVVATRYDGPAELTDVIDIFLYEKDGTQVVTDPVTITLPNGVPFDIKTGNNVLQDGVVVGTVANDVSSTTDPTSFQLIPSSSLRSDSPLTIQDVEDTYSWGETFANYDERWQSPSYGEADHIPDITLEIFVEGKTTFQHQKS